MTEPLDASELTRLRSRWEFTHASALLVLGSVVAMGAVPLGVVAGLSAISLALRVGLDQGSWTPRGQFGGANAITALRLALTLLLLAWGAEWPGWAVGSAASATLLLDIVDGWWARRFDQASAFGAAFDVESDALLVLTLSLLLGARGVATPWVAIAGLWRYAFVVLVTLVPSPNIETQRARYGRAAYFFMVASFVLAASWPPPAPLAGPVCVLATGVLSASFLWSLLERYRTGSRC